MEDIQNPSYYSILTAEVRYCKEIPANAKLLYSEITALTNAYGFCFASNNYFAERYGVTPQAVSKWINILENKGFIKLEYEYGENKQIVKRRIYLRDTVSTNIDGVSTNIDRGINICLQGYQQKIKDNNKYINNKFNNKFSPEDEKDEIIKEQQKEIEKLKKTKKVSSKLLSEEELNEYWKNKPSEARKIIDDISFRMYTEHNKADPKFIRNRAFILNQSIELYEYIWQNFRDEKEMKKVFEFAINDNFWHDKAMIPKVFLRNYETILIKSKNSNFKRGPAFEDKERVFDVSTEGGF